MARPVNSQLSGVWVLTHEKIRCIQMRSSLVWYYCKTLFALLMAPLSCPLLIAHAQISDSFAQTRSNMVVVVVAVVDSGSWENLQIHNPPKPAGSQVVERERCSHARCVLVWPCKCS
mmetsp:Transcript_145275/g.253515  ORF Transcript_145275/g.253515 Transcript_145275/m.253515 type:complete len:117 (+) Transcript_145275:527-877(+)